MKAILRAISINSIAIDARNNADFKEISMAKGLFIYWGKMCGNPVIIQEI